MINIQDVPKFKKWLINKGCEILPPTNEFEVLRFKGKETAVFYNTGKTSNQYANKAYIAFKTNAHWTGGPVKTGRQNSYKKEKINLLERDGDCCFLCGNKLLDDITVEHLIALSNGGKNNLSNMVLMHVRCNNQVSNIPISDKVKMAISYRTKQ
ncbi:HNH endonuclease [Flavobacterium sp.]